MNTRQRFLAVLNFAPCDHPPYWEWAYWPQTLDRWYSEGLPCLTGYPADMQKSDPINGGAGDWRPPMPREDDARRELGLDEGIFHPPVYGRIAPPHQREVLRETEHDLTFIDTDGVTKRILKDKMSMPEFISFPIKTDRDWQEMKANMNWSLAARVPAEWNQYVAQLHPGRSFPVSLLGFPEGLFGQLRDMLGIEALIFAFTDNPGLVRDILNTLTDLWISLWEEETALFEADSVTFWEDMCYRAGPLISPRMFREFLLPCYRRLTDFGRGRGIRHYLVDTDGDMRKLIPLWIEGGITGVYPFEVQANMNVEEIGRQYPDLVVLGGIDKREIDLGPDAIDAELEKRVPFLLQRGGYLPTLDHHVTPEVSWQDFSYYRRRLADYCERLSPQVKKKPVA